LAVIVGGGDMFGSSCGSEEVSSASVSARRECSVSMGYWPLSLHNGGRDSRAGALSDDGNRASIRSWCWSCSPTVELSSDVLSSGKDGGRKLVLRSSRPDELCGRLCCCGSARERLSASLFLMRSRKDGRARRIGLGCKP